MTHRVTVNGRRQAEPGAGAEGRRFGKRNSPSASIRVIRRPIKLELLMNSNSRWAKIAQEIRQMVKPGQAQSNQIKPSQSKKWGLTG
jgi:hypothetical protein